MESIRSAYKRSRHFADIEFDGPFSPLKTSQQNFTLMIDLTANDFSFELQVLRAWANRINALCDTRKMQDEQNEINGMAAFLSFMWFDTIKLTERVK